MLVAALACLFGGSATGASSSTVVSVTVPSATSLSTTGCQTGTAGSTDLGNVLPGSSVTSSIDCSLVFGSSNDSSMLRLYQSDGAGRAMHPSPCVNVLACWRFDGSHADGTATANAVSARSAPNDPSFATGRPGNGSSLAFDGDDGATAPAHASYDVDTFTVDAWIYLEGMTGVAGDDKYVVQRSGGAPRQFNLTARLTSSTTAVLRAYATVNGGTSTGAVLGTVNLNDGGWHHVAMVVDSTPADPSKTLTIYVDGVADGTRTFSGDIDNPAMPIHVGQRSDDTQHMQGRIDELRLSPRALTSAQVAAYVQDTAGIADYAAATADWTAGANAFGACLRAVGGGATTSGTTWAPDGDADCSDGNVDPWRPVVTTSGTAGAKVASAPIGTTTATAHLRFGFRAAATQAPGRYEAPVTFETVAPDA